MGSMWAMSQSFGFCCGYPIVGYNTGGWDPNAPGKAGGAAIAPQVLPRLASGNRQDQFTHCMTPLALPHGGLHDRRPGPVCAWQGQCGAANSQQVLPCSAMPAAMPSALFGVHNVRSLRNPAAEVR